MPARVPGCTEVHSWGWVCWELQWLGTKSSRNFVTGHLGLCAHGARGVRACATASLFYEDTVADSPVASLLSVDSGGQLLSHLGSVYAACCTAALCSAWDRVDGRGLPACCLLPCASMLLETWVVLPSPLPPHGCPWFLVDSLIFIPRYDPGYQVTPSRPLCLLPEQAVCDLLHNHASLLELLHNREGHAVLTEGPGEHSALPGEHTSREIQPHGYAAYSLTSQGLAHSRCPVYASVE